MQLNSSINWTACFIYWSYDGAGTFTCTAVWQFGLGRQLHAQFPWRSSLKVLSDTHCQTYVYTVSCAHCLCDIYEVKCPPCSWSGATFCNRSWGAFVCQIAKHALLLNHHSHLHTQQLCNRQNIWNLAFAIHISKQKRVFFIREGLCAAVFLGAINSLPPTSLWHSPCVHPRCRRTCIQKMMPLQKYS